MSQRKPLANTIITVASLKNTKDNKHKHDPIWSRRELRPTFWDTRDAVYEHQFLDREKYNYFV